MMAMRRLVWIGVTGVCLAGPAAAQVSEDWQRCVNERGTYILMSPSPAARA
jgi:hypothetical protein